MSSSRQVFGLEQRKGKMKVLHHNDNDGRCAGFLFSVANPELSPQDFFEMDYDRTFPWDQIKDGELVVFLDFHPERIEDYKRLRKNHAVIIFDHHKSTLPHLKEMDKKLGLKPIPENDLIIHHHYCGAMLVWNRFYPQNASPLFVRLVDDWDRWEFEYPETKFFNSGSKCYDTSAFGGFWSALYLDYKTGINQRHFLDLVVEQGKTIQQYQSIDAKETIKSMAFPVEFEGFKCLAVNRRCNSLWFKSEPDYDIYLPFTFNGQAWTVSLYSSKVDVSEIAKKHGGGGHAGAAGFVCEKLPFKKGE